MISEVVCGCLNIIPFLLKSLLNYCWPTWSISCIYVVCLNILDDHKKTDIIIWSFALEIVIIENNREHTILNKVKKKNCNTWISTPTFFLHSEARNSKWTIHTWRKSPAKNICKEGDYKGPLATPESREKALLCVLTLF